MEQSSIITTYLSTVNMEWRSDKRIHTTSEDVKNELDCEATGCYNDIHT